MGISLKVALVYQIHNSRCSVTHELRLTRLIGLAVEMVDSTSNEKGPLKSIETNGDQDTEK